MIEILVRNARVAGHAGLVDIGVAAGRIAMIRAANGEGMGGAEVIDADSCLLVPGLVETHFHLDKTCIMDRCSAVDGTVAEAVRLTSAAKRNFTAEDIHARAERILRQAIGWGTMRMRTHVELDPGIRMVGFEAIEALAREYRWAVDLELCVFPQEGLLNNPGTDALLIEGLRRGARAIGAAPYVDSDPRGQIDRIFEIGRDWDAEIDMHLDLADTTEGMQVEHVCRRTEEYGWGGRVAIGHVTQMTLVPPARFAELASRLANAGVAVTILPSTDLYLMGRNHDHAIPRGVVAAESLRAAGVTCSIATNNVLNPFTPYGDANLLRMANLYANICQVARHDELVGCMQMVTSDAARLMRLDDYGIAVGMAADLVALDAAEPAEAVAGIAAPLWGMKAGRVSFSRARPVLFPPG